MSQSPVRVMEPSATPSPRADWCGGALLRLSREGLAEMRRSGVVFSTVENNGNERSDARKVCRGLIYEPKPGYRSALCPSCEELEANVRRELRARYTP